MRIPTPARAEDLASATCRAPPPAHRLPWQPGMQPGGWNGTEGASTPPLSPRFPNDRGGKFTSRDGVAFCWVNLTPFRRGPSLGSPSRLAEPGAAFICTLKPTSRVWTTCTATSGQEPVPCLASRNGPRLRAPYSPLVAERPPSALLGCLAPGSEVHSGSGRRHAPAPGALLHSACVGEQAASVRRGRERVCICASVCVRARARPSTGVYGVYVCARASSRVGRGCAGSEIPLCAHPALCLRLRPLLAPPLACTGSRFQDLLFV